MTAPEVAATLGNKDPSNVRAKPARWQTPDF